MWRSRAVAVALGVAERGGGEAVEVEGRAGGEFGGLEIERFAAHQIRPEGPLVAERQVGQIGRLRARGKETTARSGRNRVAPPRNRAGAATAASTPASSAFSTVFFRNPPRGGRSRGRSGRGLGAYSIPEEGRILGRHDPGRKAFSGDFASPRGRGEPFPTRSAGPPGNGLTVYRQFLTQRISQPC